MILEVKNKKLKKKLFTERTKYSDHSYIKNFYINNISKLNFIYIFMLNLLFKCI